MFCFPVKASGSRLGSSNPDGACDLNDDLLEPDCMLMLGAVPTEPDCDVMLLCVCTGSRGREAKALHVANRCETDGEKFSAEGSGQTRLRFARVQS